MVLFKRKNTASPAGQDAKKPAQAKSVKTQMPKKAFSARFVFFVGDEGAILIYSKDGAVKTRLFVADSSKPNLDQLSAYLAEDTNAPILMVMDNMDQSYVQQSLPPVSSLSVQKLIKRRLDRDFGANDMKGAIMIGREKTGRKDWNFMMIALEQTPQVTSWLTFLLELPNPFQGVCLAAVEIENVVKELDPVLAGSQAPTGSEWKFFVSHNKVGGFRQVILRNGRIVFTRMAQPMADMAPEAVAGSIEQEMTSTIEYMRRLSFDAQAGLDIYIIVSSAIKSAIDKSKFNCRAIHIMTPFEAAQHLNIQGATQATDQFGDVVLAASIGSIKKHILTLVTPEAERLKKMSSWIAYQRMAAIAIGAGGVLYALSLAYGIFQAYSEEADLEQQKLVRKNQLTSLHENLERSGLDIAKTSDMIDLYTKLMDQQLSPVPAIYKMASVFKPPIVVKAVDWSLDDNSNNTNAKTKPNSQPSMVFTLTIQFPGVLGVEAFRIVSKKLLDTLQKELDIAPDDASFAKLPSMYMESDKLDVTIGAENSALPTGQAPDVQLIIRKSFAAKPAQPE